MKIFTLRSEIALPINIQEAWTFFSDPKNLQVITPPKMGFNITSKHLPDSMHPGMIITYKVSPLLGIKLTWVTEITHVLEERMFVDEQRFGPYIFWHHQHYFESIQGGTRCTDLVHYAVPGWFLAPLVNTVLVQRELDGIFKFREKKLFELFGKLNLVAV